MTPRLLAFRETAIAFFGKNHSAIQAAAVPPPKPSAVPPLPRPAREHRPCGRREATPRDQFIIQRIQRLTAAHYQVGLDDLSGARGTARISNARAVAAFLALEFIPDLSLRATGKYFNRHHQSMIYLRDCAEERMTTYPGVFAAVTSLRAQVKLALGAPAPHSAPRNSFRSVKLNPKHP